MPVQAAETAEMRRTIITRDTLAHTPLHTYTYTHLHTHLHTPTHTPTSTQTPTSTLLHVPRQTPVFCRQHDQLTHYLSRNGILFCFHSDNAIPTSHRYNSRLRKLKSAPELVSLDIIHQLSSLWDVLAIMYRVYFPILLSLPLHGYWPVDIRSSIYCKLHCAHHRKYILGRKIYPIRTMQLYNVRK